MTTGVVSLRKEEGSMHFCHFCVGLPMLVAGELGHGAVPWQGRGSRLEEQPVVLIACPQPSTLCPGELPDISEF